jgi:hypothetical protein
MGNLPAAETRLSRLVHNTIACMFDGKLVGVYRRSGIGESKPLDELGCNKWE